MIKYLQLNQQFDVQQMQQEVALLESDLWKAHYNTAHYQGGWTILPLRSINGSIDNIISIHSAAAETIPAYQDTVLLEQCNYIRSVLDFFACEKTAVRLMKLHAGAVIKEHSDHDMRFEDGEVRLHIPVMTNPAVEFFLDDERVIMQEGECWYLNLSLRHRVRNAGDTDRVHLVIDCLVNDWVKEQFTNHAHHRLDVMEEKEPGTDRETKDKIIRELRHLNTPTAIALANQLEKELL